MPRSYYDFSQISLKSWGKRKKYQRYFRMLFYAFFPATFLKAALYKVFVIWTTVFYKDFQPWEKLQKHLWKKYDIFSRLFDIANRPLTRHSPFAQLRQVDEWTAKPSPFSIHGRLS